MKQKDDSNIFELSNTERTELRDPKHVEVIQASDIVKIKN